MLSFLIRYPALSTKEYMIFILANMSRLRLKTIANFLKCKTTIQIDSQMKNKQVIVKYVVNPFCKIVFATNK